MFSSLHPGFTQLHVDLLFRLPGSAATQVVMMRFPQWLAAAARGELVAPDEIAIYSRGQTVVISAEGDGVWSVRGATGHALVAEDRFVILATAVVERYLQARAGRSRP